jgi:head-tail adaptor
MNSPAYNRPLTIQRIVAAPDEDDYGQIDLTDADNWETVYTGFCRKLTQGSREFIRATRLDTAATCVLELPWASTLAALAPQRVRILFDGHRYELNGTTDPDDEHAKVQLLCSEPQGDPADG